jgi:arylsulfatase A-like enzyme
LWPARTLLAFLVVAVACVGRPPRESTRPLTTALEEAPNVLIILTDDQRADGLSTMPKTERWFRDGGVHYPRAFATTPLCCPFRASLFSGRYAHNHGVHVNTDVAELDQDTTLQHYLREAGFFTAIAGKFLNNWSIDRAPPNFDRWTFFAPTALERGYYDVEFNVDGKRRTVHRYSTNFLSDVAVDTLEYFERDDRRPWLLYVTPFAPHTPYTTSPRYFPSPVPKWKASPAVTERGLYDKPHYVRASQVPRSESRFIRIAQLRSLKPVDDLVDRLLRVMRKLDEGRRTLAFFMSDGGYVWGEHGLLGKRVPYTPSVRIPFYVRWPGRLPQGRSDNSVVANIDVAPTVLEATSMRADAAVAMDGRSLLGSRPLRPRVLIEQWRDPGTRGWTWASSWTPRYQYIEYYGEGGRSVEFRELYDLRTDPWQTHNVLNDLDAANDPRPRFVARLSRRLSRDRNCSGRSCP